MKCLLTGGFGNLGQELRKCSAKYGIEYIVPTKKELDISNSACVRAFQCEKLDCVVHCAAYTNVPGAEVDRVQAIETNIFGTKTITNEFCKPNGVSLVYISTDYVYPGINGNYKETDITCPINFYALTKLAGEAYVRSKDLIIRTSFKPIEWKYKSAFNDLFTSADYIDIISEKISLLIANNAKGIYNVGTEKKSVYDLAKRRNKDVQPMSRREIAYVNLPIDTSMNVDKYIDFALKTKQSGGQ
jgi:dTDP-4-dehydrorhamnose reductase